jgi:hypothetical protein
MKYRLLSWRLLIGLGTSSRLGVFDLFHLSRQEVRSDYNLERFIKLLPWNDVPAPNLP